LQNTPVQTISQSGIATMSSKKSPRNENERPRLVHESVHSSETAATEATPLNVRSKQRNIKVAGEHATPYDLTAVDGDSEFACTIMALFADIRPKKIIETGTYLGEGTTRIIASTLKSLGITDSVFCTIECNPGNYHQAQANLAQRGLIDGVHMLHGLSVPRCKLPTIEEIEQSCVNQIEYDDIFVDHQEQQRALLYYRETDFTGVEEDMLGRALEVYGDRPDFVLLDSGGHMGYVEFNYLISRLKGPCYLALDDIFHIKHHKSYRQMQTDSRFEILKVSQEKFGFCLAKFTPDQPTTLDGPKRLIWLRPDSIGDNILSAAMLPHIRDNYPQAHITVVCQEHIAEFYETCPHVNEIVPFNRRHVMEDGEYLDALMSELKGLKADLLLNSVYSRDPLADLLAFACDARESVALDGDTSNMTAETRQEHNRLYSRIIPSPGVRKGELERHRDFLIGLGIPSNDLAPTAWITPDDAAWAEAVFSENGFEAENTIVMFAGAQYAVRHYEKYGEALAPICREHDLNIIALGSVDDIAITLRNLGQISGRTLNLCGKTTLRQSAALISRCRLAVGAETGLAHLACAVDTPNVVLLGGGHFGRFMPYCGLTTVACLPLSCYACNWQCRYNRSHCVTDLSPTVLERAIRTALSGPSECSRIIMQAENEWKSDSLLPAWQECGGHLGLPLTHTTAAQAPEKTDGKGYPYLVSAVVSTYNSERFIRGCLEDLTQQTLYKRGQLEIVIVDSGSQQGESEIILTFMESCKEITYIRTERESLYAAWNRGIMASSGKYITNANTDDRHHPEALEIMSRTLENTPGTDLVYGDCYVSTIPNETFAENRKDTVYRYPEFFAPAALLHYQLGPQPMWRRSLHDRIGFFDGSYKAAGDYDFNIRLALHCKAQHIPEVLGLYLEHEAAISFKDDTMQKENQRISDQYKHVDMLQALYHAEGISCDSGEELARVCVDMGIRALEYYPPWKGGTAETNISLAGNCFRTAVDLNSRNAAAVNNLAVFEFSQGNPSRAHQLLTEFLKSDTDPVIAHNFRQMCREAGVGASLKLLPSGLELPTQQALFEGSCRNQNTDSWQAIVAARPDHTDCLAICMVASAGRIDPFDATGGLETAMRATATALARRGHRVALVGTMTRAAGTYLGVLYIPFADWCKNSYPDFAERVDVLAFSSGPDLGCYNYVDNAPVKVALFHHQELSFLSGTDALNVLNVASDAVICVSKAVRNNLQRDGVLLHKLHVVHNGVDHDTFTPRNIERSWQRILFVGALVPDKNVEMLIRAFLEVSPAFPEAELHICGDASLWGAAEFIDRDAVARLSSKVFFHGTLSQEELAFQYSQSAICVIPSKFESFSLVSLEAQSCGCVPLVADVGGVPETILADSTGITYAPNDTETLAENLRQLLSNKDRLKSLSKKAIAFVGNNFSWDKTAEHYEKIFYNLLNKKVSDTSTAGSPSPRVSVIIPCYNYAHYLTNAVESVIAQSFQEYEIIIVNDGSTDDSRRVAEQLIAAYPSRRIRLINQDNSGDPSLARNRGIREARGEFVLCLDADDMLMPEFLFRCVALLDNEQDIAIAYTDQIYFGSGNDRVVQVADYDFIRLTQANFMGYCSLFRKSAWNEVGGFKAGIGYEDWEFWISCGEQGHYAKRIPEPLFCYRQHSGGRYEMDQERDAQIRANIVRLHPSIYTVESVQSAGQPHAGGTGSAKNNRNFRVIALISAHNEGDVIYHVLGDLVLQGIEVYLINHCSTDNTVEEASKWLGKGLIHIENFPQDAGYPEANKDEYIWHHILRRKEELAAQLDADWYIHSDSDEFRESPWPGLTLKQAIQVADQCGYNALDFELLNFRPIDNHFVAGTDVREALCYYEGCEDFNSRQIKAWKNLRAPVDIHQNGGHDINFAGRSVCPTNFILRHYPIRSQAHGEQKVFNERKKRFNTQERQVGWHVQYDTIKDQGHNFLQKPADLTLYDGDQVRLRILSAPALKIAASLSGAQAAPAAASTADTARKSPDPVQADQGNFTGENIQLLIDTGNDLAKGGNVIEAAQLYQQALAVDPGNCPALVGIGVLKIVEGKHSEAVIAFSKALKFSPSDAKALCGLALVRSAQGRHCEGFELFKKALDTDPENLTALHELLRLAYELNRHSEAEPYLRKYLMYHPSDFHLLYSLAGLHHRMGKHAEALDILERILALEPGYEGCGELAELARQALCGVDGEVLMAAGA